jgi:hypothetical protein
MPDSFDEMMIQSKRWQLWWKRADCQWNWRKLLLLWDNLRQL